MEYLNKIDKTKICKDSIIILHKNCYVESCAEIADKGKILRNISGMPKNDGVITLVSDLGGVYSLDDNELKIIHFNRQNSKVDFEEIQFNQNNQKFYISREDENSIHIYDMKMMYESKIYLDSVFLKQLSYNTGVEAFVFFKDKIILFPERVKGSDEVDVCVGEIKNDYIECKFYSFYSKARITAASISGDSIYLTKVLMDRTHFFYRVSIEKIDMDNFIENSCIQPETIALFEFSSKEAKASYTGNFEALSASYHHDHVELISISDDNNGLYGEVTVNCYQ